MANWIKDLVEQRIKREQQARLRDEAARLTELRALSMDPTASATTMPMDGGFVANMPDIFTPRDEARLPLALTDAGYKPEDLALARTRQLQGDEVAMRTRAVANVLTDPDADPLIAADVANSRKVSDDGQLVKVRDPAGDRYFRQRRRGVTDEFDYEPVTDDQQQPLRIPREVSPVSETSEERNIRNRARILRRSNPKLTPEQAEEEAYRSVTTLKVAAPDAQSMKDWALASRQAAASMDYGAWARKPDEFRRRTEQYWRNIRGDEQPPITDPIVPASADPAGAPPAGRAPAAPTATPAKYPTAVNPQTKQRLIFKDGQWQPE